MKNMTTAALVLTLALGASTAAFAQSSPNPNNGTSTTVKSPTGNADVTQGSQSGGSTNPNTGKMGATDPSPMPSDMMKKMKGKTTKSKSPANNTIPGTPTSTGSSPGAAK